VPDLPGPALAHHGRELGLASLRASLDHLRVGHHRHVPGIDLRLQLGVRRGLYHRVLHHLQGFQCLVSHCHPPPLDVFVGIKIKTHFAKFYMEVRTISILPLIFSCRTLPGPRQPNNTNRINKRITALPNAKSMLLNMINTVTKPYTDATATTQETVIRVSSSNLSSIDDDGELLVSSCYGGLL